MLTNEQVTQLCQDLGLSPEARAVIDAIRAAPPARWVRGGAGNVSVRYPSRKMGVTIQAESHRNELAGVYEKEHDPATLEYYDQPPPIKLVYPARSGRRVGVFHTPDYFVLRIDSVGWEEWKTEEELARLAETMPHRYVCTAGHWQCPPGEDYAAPLSFFYRVRSSAEIDWVFQRNLLFLEDYLRADCPDVSATTADALHTLVANQPGMPLVALLNQLDGVRSDDVYRLIATERLIVDLRSVALAEPERVPVFPDPETARAYAVLAATSSSAPTGPTARVGPVLGSPIVWDGRVWTIVNTGQTTLSLLAADGTLVALPATTFDVLVRQGKVIGWTAPTPASQSTDGHARLACASPGDFVEANRRYAIIAPRLAGTTSSAETTPARTVRYWLAQWRHAEQVDGCGYVGLLPRCSARGNRTPKLPEATLRLLDDFVCNDYETLKQKSRSAVYLALVRACEAHGTPAPSYKTLTRAVAGRPRHEQVAKRAGARAAYQESPFYWELTLTTPRHGDRPFEIGHVDHTQLDVELVCSRTGRNLGRPWATFLTDAFSRRLLAFVVSFDPPSYRAGMLVLRACVRRHQRLPQVIVVDGGAEFASVYFETLLARYTCTKKTRPGAQPRFGAVCERLFGTTNSEFLHTLAGNTQVLQNTRQVTKAIQPKQHACWTLDRLVARLSEWADEIYDTRDHPALGQSPRDAFVAGLLQGGPRLHRRIPDDEDFRMLTLPSTPKGTAKLHPRRGVKINHLFYWSDAFVNSVVAGTQVPVRFDPFDAGLAYAYVKGRWVRCLGEYHAIFAGHSEREIQLATVELRRRKQQHGRTVWLTARKLADFLASVEAEEVLLEQRLRDAAAQDVVRLGARDLGRASTPAEETIVALSAEPDGDGGPAQSTEPLVVYEDY
ncbi:MAG: DDE-type integrase/transposase/recombinase [Gemmatimonadota bacterium]|nr:DDE-type integrase/transposase/recombinase [Gemmatimonadota bacterium]